MKQKGPERQSRFQEDNDFESINNNQQNSLSPFQPNYQRRPESDDESTGLLKKKINFKMEVNANLNGLKLDKSLDNSRDMEIQTDPTIDEYLELVGGFGRFQFFAFLVLFLLIQPTGFLLYNIPFLEYEPALKCQQKLQDKSLQNNNEWFDCSKQIACFSDESSNLNHIIDFDNSRTLKNFITDIGMECESKFNIKLIGSFYFVGMIISIILWIKCTDYLGRKNIIALGSMLQLLAYSGVCFDNHSLSKLYVIYFMLGIGSVITICTSYNYMIEFTPKKYKIAVGTLYLAFQILPCIITPVYLTIMFSHDLSFLMIIGFLAGMSGFILLFPLPESPHYYYSKDCYIECQDALNYIARFNGSEHIVDMTRQIEEKSNSSFQRLQSTLKETQFRWFIRQIMQNNHNANFLVLITCWTVASFNYYLILFHLQDMSGSIYMNSIAGSLGEFTGSVLIGSFIIEYGQKNTMLISFTLMIVTALIYQLPILSTPIYFACSIFGLKLALCFGFASTFTGSNSMFKEELVAIIFAICNLVARFFSIFAPIVASSENPNTVIYSYILLSIIGVLCSFCLDENGTRKRSRKNSPFNNEQLSNSQSSHQL